MDNDAPTVASTVTYCGYCTCRTISPPCACKCHAGNVDYLRAALDSERARADNYLGAFRREQERADRYLAAMQALIDGYRTNPEYLAAVAAIRAIVEEARRG